MHHLNLSPGEEDDYVKVQPCNMAGFKLLLTSFLKALLQ
jgi:hypothetical protein